MNLPNKLTVLRMALVPVFIVLYCALGLYGNGTVVTVGAFLVFGFACLTDALDGKIARERNMITNFGKLMDPLADKVLTMAAFVLFVADMYMPAWMLVVFLAREFAITGLRAVAAAEGEVIPAGLSGKFKTILQMSSILVILLSRILYSVPWNTVDFVVFNIGYVLLWAALAVTVWSGAEYLYKGRHLLNMK
jgi:CDP-diacylglycerol--glycerol-3-phosphate 3-phosphatidyltransferase/cardiolipin synthase